MKIRILLAALLLMVSSYVYASLIIPIYLTSDKGEGAKVGYVKADDTVYGLLLTPNLHGLSPGLHGFHIHELAFCSDHGKAAGGHLDPEHTNQHKGPYEGSGHLGDLPALYVDEKGNATLPVLAPRLKLDVIKGHSLMIHAGGDNYSDKPEKLGGGGERIACGVIPYH